MIPASLILAAWLSPAVWLQMPALILGRGPDGLWIALSMALAPLIALGVRAGSHDADHPSSAFSIQ